MESKQLQEQNIAPISILYDSQCGFCNRVRVFAENRAPKHAFVFSHTDNNETITVYTLKGDALYKYRACLYVLRRLTLPWRILGYLGLVVPRAVGDWGYSVVARNRHRL